MTLERAEFSHAHLEVERVRVRIGGGELQVSWHPPDRAPDGQRHGAEGICVTASGEVIVVSRDGHMLGVPRRST